MIIFDEKRYAEKMLKSGFLTKHKNVYELNILSKYYFSEGKFDHEVKDLIVRFCEKNVEYFNIDEWYKIINKTISIASKGILVYGIEVPITESELEIIRSPEKLNEQKVVFVLLVLFKFHGFKKFEVSIEDLYRLCKLNINSKSKLEILQSLTSKDLIDISMGGKRSVKFADKKGNAVINIKNFDDFILEYLKYIGENIINCETCNKATKPTGKNQRMCSECWKGHREQQNRDKALKYYHKNKI